MKLFSVIELFAAVILVDSTITDYFKPIGSFFGYSEEVKTNEVIDFQKKVPYQLSLTDEKFISEAVKLTGVTASDLDSCQHRIILQLHKSCDKLNDEELAKMAVMLLNCQSAVEGRRQYPCTASMAIKECTIDMDADTWNTYHLMSNRARAVCYYIRSIQFRGLTELTVNQLMDSARNQLKTMDEIAKDQKLLQIIASNTMSVVSSSYKDLSEQQEDLKKAQFQGQLSIEDNIKRLQDEKYMINENKRLFKLLTVSLNKQLENAIKELETHSEERHSNHLEVVQDLVEIQSLVGSLFKQIEDFSKLLTIQNDLAKQQYNSMVTQLTSVNDTIHTLLVLVDNTKQIVENRLFWLSEVLGDTDWTIERLYLVFWHFLFLIAVMIISAFLNAYISTRMIVTILPSVNLMLALNQTQHALNPLELAVSIAGLLLIQTFVFFALNYKKMFLLRIGFHSKQKLGEEAKMELNESEDDSDYNESVAASFSSFRSKNNFAQPTPPLSMNGYSRSRSRTPFLNRSQCSAITRSGTNCKCMSIPGRDLCHRHLNGDSVILS